MGRKTKNKQNGLKTSNRRCVNSIIPSKHLPLLP